MQVDVAILGGRLPVNPIIISHRVHIHKPRTEWRRCFAHAGFPRLHVNTGKALAFPLRPLQFLSRRLRLIKGLTQPVPYAQLVE